MWVNNIEVKYIIYDLEISQTTAADWGSFCREVCYHAFTKKRQPFGGEGIVVEIYESIFGHRKYHVGREVEGQWVFERGTGHVFLETVDFRNTDTLVPLIKKWIRPGSTIISDCWKAYKCLPQFGYTHLTVNHSKNFVDPVTGAHTNSIEGTWRAVKAVVRQPGRRREAIAGNLSKYIFQKKCREEKSDVFIEILKLAGDMYNPVRTYTEHQLDLGDEDSSSDSD